MAAHKLLGEEPHFGGKYSEDVIQDGIKTLEEMKRTPARPHTPSAAWHRGVPASNATPASSPSAQQPATARSGHAPGRRGFGSEDLKELRKAIKVNDKKKIAELTAKLGKLTCP